MNSATTDTGMILAPLECAYAQEIKDVVTELEEFSDLNVSDFEFAQHALFAEGHLETALFRLQGIHDFRKEYKITSDPSKSVEEGMSILRAFMEQQPGLLLDAECNPRTGSCILALDFAKVDPSKVRLPEECRVFLGGMYYLYELLQPSFQCIREGLCLMCELEGYGWKNFSVDFHRTNYHHFHRYYPIKTKSIKWVHATVIGNLLHSFFKTIFGQRELGIHLGCALDARLDQVLCQDELLQKLRQALMVRYANQAKFRLPSIGGGTPAADGDATDPAASASEANDDAAANDATVQADAN